VRAQRKRERKKGGRFGGRIDDTHLHAQAQEKAHAIHLLNPARLELRGKRIRKRRKKGKKKRDARHLILQLNFTQGCVSRRKKGEGVTVTLCSIWVTYGGEGGKKKGEELIPT